jgi:hypothetical protein
MRKKMNLYKIYDEVEKVSNIIKHERLIKFRPIDYLEYIEKPINTFIKVWKYDGVYYKSLTRLYKVLDERGLYSRGSRTFKSMCENLDRQIEMWDYRIQLVFAKYIELINRYITCEGVILTEKNLSVIRGNPYNSEFSMILNKEQVSFNRAHVTWKSFVTDIGIEKGMYHVDRDFGNCGIDNLFISVPKSERL